MITSGGYQLIAHKYTTEDGYINTVYRLVSRTEAKKTILKNLREMKQNDSKLFFSETPDENSQHKIGEKPVVILQHGLFDSFLAYLLNETDSIGYKLVDAGYDVWLNNSRGNRYSKDHQFLDIKFNQVGEDAWAVNPDLL